jgi:hypothetical protein
VVANHEERAKYRIAVVPTPWNEARTRAICDQILARITEEVETKGFAYPREICAEVVAEWRKGNELVQMPQTFFEKIRGEKNFVRYRQGKKLRFRREDGRESVV